MMAGPVQPIGRDKKLIVILDSFSPRGLLMIGGPSMCDAMERRLPFRSNWKSQRYGDSLHLRAEERGLWLPMSLASYERAHADA
jgi:hypothetical protein